LKDEQTVESYGILNDSTVHLVKGKPAGAAAATTESTSAATESTASATANTGAATG